MKRRAYQRRPVAPLEPMTRQGDISPPTERRTLPKESNFVCLEYRLFVRKLPCLFKARDPGQCGGQVVAHHVRRRGSGVTDDRTVVALCAHHHAEVHAGTCPDADLKEADATLLMFIKEANGDQIRAFGDAVTKRDYARIF